MRLIAALFAMLTGIAAGHPVPDPAGGTTAWGKPSEGLQAGIRCPKDKHVLPRGQQVELEIVVRNVSDHPVKFDYVPPTQFWGTAEQSVVDVTCMAINRGSPRSDGLGFANSVTIAPGKEMLLGAISLGHVRVKDPKAAYLPRPELAPGKYQVGSRNVLVPFAEDKSNRVLSTGYIDIQLQPGK